MGSFSLKKEDSSQDLWSSSKGSNSTVGSSLDSTGASLRRSSSGVEVQGWTPGAGAKAEAVAPIMSHWAEPQAPAQTRGDRQGEAQGEALSGIARFQIAHLATTLNKLPESLGSAGARSEPTLVAAAIKAAFTGDFEEIPGDVGAGWAELRSRMNHAVDECLGAGPVKAPFELLRTFRRGERLVSRAAKRDLASLEMKPGFLRTMKRRSAMRALMAGGRANAKAAQLKEPYTQKLDVIVAPVAQAPINAYSRLCSLFSKAVPEAPMLFDPQLPPHLTRSLAHVRMDPRLSYTEDTSNDGDQEWLDTL